MTAYGFDTDKNKIPVVCGERLIHVTGTIAPNSSSVQIIKKSTLIALGLTTGEVKKYIKILSVTGYRGATGDLYVNGEGDLSASVNSLGVNMDNNSTEFTYTYDVLLLNTYGMECSEVNN